jgi:ABC-2 type transport system permease protein
VLAAYLGDIRFELTKMLRTPMFAVPTMLFPLMFFLLFGVVMGSARATASSRCPPSRSSAYSAPWHRACSASACRWPSSASRECSVRQAVPMPAGSYYWRAWSWP